MIADPLHGLPGRRYGAAGAVLGLVCGGVLSFTAWLTTDPAADALLGLATLIVALAYGAMRIVQCHPGSNPEYREWLARTPWRWPQRLPYRSPFLTVNDGTFVVAFSLLCPSGIVAGAALVGLGFACGYVGAIPMNATNDDKGFLAIGVLLLCGLAIAGFIGPSGPSLLPLYLAAAVALGLSQVSLSRGIHKLSESMLQGAEQQPIDPQSSRQIGSPYGQLLYGLEPDGEANSWWSLALPVLYLAACLEFCLFRARAWVSEVDMQTALESQWQESFLGMIKFLVYFGNEAYREADPDQIAFGFMAGVGLFLFLYVVLLGLNQIGRHAAPISLPGRIRQGTWIIPGYDIIWMAPLVSFASYPVWGASLLAMGIPPVSAGAISLVFSALVYSKLAPSPRAWRLTGHHRLLLGGPNRPSRVNERAARR